MKKLNLLLVSVLFSSSVSAEFIVPALSKSRKQKNLGPIAVAASKRKGVAAQVETMSTEYVKATSMESYGFAHGNGFSFEGGVANLSNKDEYGRFNEYKDDSQFGSLAVGYNLKDKVVGGVRFTRNQRERHRDFITSDFAGNIIDLGAAYITKDQLFIGGGVRHVMTNKDYNYEDVEKYNLTKKYNKFYFGIGRIRKDSDNESTIEVLFRRVSGIDAQKNGVAIQEEFTENEFILKTATKRDYTEVQGSISWKTMRDDSEGLMRRALVTDASIEVELTSFLYVTPGASLGRLESYDPETNLYVSVGGRTKDFDASVKANYGEYIRSNYTFNLAYFW